MTKYNQRDVANKIASLFTEEVWSFCDKELFLSRLTRALQSARNEALEEAHNAVMLCEVDRDNSSKDDISADDWDDCVKTCANEIAKLMEENK